MRFIINCGSIIYISLLVLVLEEVGGFVLFLPEPNTSVLQQDHLSLPNLATRVATLLQRNQHGVFRSRGGIHILFDDGAQSSLGDVRAVRRMVVVTSYRHDLRGIIFRHHATATSHARARPPALARLLPVFLAESEAVTCVHCI